MSIKSRIDFEQASTVEQVAQEQAKSASLNAQQLFDENTQFELVAAEEELAEIIIDSKPKRRWGLKALGISFLSLVGWQTVDHIASAFAQGDWLSLGWGGFVGALSLLGVRAVGSEWLYLRRLKQRQSERERGEQLLVKEGIGEAKAFCQKVVEKGAKHSEGYDRWLHSLSATHNDREVLEMFDSMVLTAQDEQARQLVAKHAKEAGLMVAVSPLATADMLLVAWRTLSMVNKLSALYGVELSYFSRIAMLKMLVRNMAMVGVSEIALDASMDMLSMDLTGKISARAGQGLGVGLLTARLGLKTMEMLRPLPWLGRRPLKLVDVRKDLLREFRRIGQGNKTETK